MNKANKKINAAIIIIGNEILSGRTQDINVSFLTKWLSNLGIRVTEVRIIEDKEAAIINTIKEVKNVTIVRKNNIAEFPDAITSRGTKHLKELINAKKKGYESYILYLIQREDCKFFKIANDIDEEYKNTFNIALKSGVKILCYDCKLSNEEIRINSQIEYEK